MVSDEYDFILIELSAFIKYTTINALTAADTVLVPIQCEYYALEGLNQMLKDGRFGEEKAEPVIGTGRRSIYYV